MSNKVVMCGCHESGLESISKLLADGLHIDYFVLVPAEKAAKLNISGYVDFEPLAKQHDIPVYYVDKYTLKSEKDQTFFKEQGFDLLIQGGWQRLFPQEILDTLRVGAIGGHGSAEFLPKGRGRSPLNWSVIEGRERFILHYFLIKPGADDGDIFHYEMFDINQWDDIHTLYLKMSMITHKVYREWIPKLLAGEYQLSPQTGKPTYYPKRTPEDGQLDWGNSMTQVYDMIRSLTKPYPGAFSFIDQQKIFLYKAHPFDTRLDSPAYRIAEIVEVFGDRSFLIKCFGGLLRVTDYVAYFELKKGQIFDDSPDLA